MCRNPNDATQSLNSIISTPSIRSQHQSSFFGAVLHFVALLMSVLIYIGMNAMQTQHAAPRDAMPASGAILWCWPLWRF